MCRKESFEGLKYYKRLLNPNLIVKFLRFELLCIFNYILIDFVLKN